MQTKEKQSNESQHFRLLLNQKVSEHYFQFTLRDVFNICTDIIPNRYTLMLN